MDRLAQVASGAVRDGYDFYDTDTTRQALAAADRFVVALRDLGRRQRRDAVDRFPAPNDQGGR